MPPLECMYCSEAFESPNSGLDSPSGVRNGRPPLYCSEACRQAAYRQRLARYREPKIPAPRVEEGKVLCLRCQEIKPVEEFYRFGTDGRLRRPCKECTRDRRRQSYRRHGGIKSVQRDNWARYGVTPDRYVQMFQEQGGTCAICHRAPGKRALSIDHCHGSGRVRRLLCVNCNAVLGHAKDNPETLLAAAAYLKAHSVDVTKHTP